MTDDNILIAGYYNHSLDCFVPAEEGVFGFVNPTSKIVSPGFSAAGSTATPYDFFDLIGWFDTVDNYGDFPITVHFHFEPEGSYLYDGATYWAIFDWD